MRFIVKELRFTYFASYSSNKQKYPVSKMLGAPAGHFFYAEPAIDLKNNL